MKATVYVRLKREVLDPQGDAVRRALTTLGFDGVKDVRVGKLIEIDLGEGARPGPELEARLKKMADEMLANGVIEDYEVRLGTALVTPDPRRIPAAARRGQSRSVARNCSGKVDSPRAHRRTSASYFGRSPS